MSPSNFTFRCVSLAKMAYLSCNDNPHVGILATYLRMTDAEESSGGRHGEDPGFQQ